MNLNEWAIKHNIPFEAVEDLRREFGIVDKYYLKAVDDMSESAVQTNVRLEASKKGLRLWRNNVGAGMMESGTFVRWGIANESSQMNKMIKSSDLIGIRPLLIEKHHIGQVIGQFVAREIKPGNWRYGATDREAAQLKFLELVASMGGDAAFATGEGTL